MKISVDKITVELSSREALILSRIMLFMLEDDPQGEASKELNIDINEVAKVGSQFRDTLSNIRNQLAP